MGREEVTMGSFRECHWMKVLELLCDICRKIERLFGFLRGDLSTKTFTVSTVVLFFCCSFLEPTMSIGKRSRIFTGGKCLYDVRVYLYCVSPGITCPSCSL